MLFLQSRSAFPVWLLLVCFLVPIAIVFIAVTVGRRRDARRLAALADVASKLGLTYAPYDQAFLGDFGGFAFHPTGFSPTATSVMRGSAAGVPMVLFDYYVLVGGHNSKSRVYLTVAAFNVAATPLPVFKVEGGRNGRFTRMLDNALAAKGIDFPDDPDFVRAFHVSGADADAVRRMLSPETRAFLLRKGGWQFRSTGRWLLMSWVKDRPEPADLGAFAEEASEVMRVLTGGRAPDPVNRTSL